MAEAENAEVVRVRSGGRVTIPRRLLTREKIAVGDLVLLSVQKAQIVVEGKEGEK